MFVRKLSSLGHVPRSADPVTVEHLIEHFNPYLLSHDTDIRRVTLHAILLTNMKCGMRFDEISKVRFGTFKCTNYGISFCVPEKTKNHRKQSHYKVRKWPIQVYDESTLIDPCIALAAWSLRRGESSEYLFCSITGTSNIRIEYYAPWKRKHFTALFCERLTSIGIPLSDVESVTGHSLKRGGVQLLRFLFIKDVS